MTILNSTPEVVFDMALDDLREELGNFLDGEEITTQGQADAIGELRERIRKTGKDADAARAAEKKPHDDAGKAVQALWKPIIQKAEDAVKACQAPLSAWLNKQEAERLRKAEEARIEADRLAAQAAAASQREDLASVSERREMQENSAAKVKEAARLEKATSSAAGDGRRIGLRSYWSAELIDAPAALRWAKRHHPDDLRDFLAELGRREVNAGARTIDGFSITEERKVA